MIYHIGAHGPGNAGDVVIQQTLRQLLQNETKEEIVLINDWFETTDEMIKNYNQATAIVVGGGGLFLKDSQPNKTSGWRWNISVRNLRKIRVPIIVFGVGYNRFRGQADFDRVFYKHIRLLINKSVFFSTRELHTPLQDFKWGQKIKYQPCPTVMLNTIRHYAPEPKKIVFVPALDRSELRYRDSDKFHTGMADVLRELFNKGWDVNIAYHISMDKSAVKYFTEFKQVDLTEMNAEDILNFYENVDAVISLRLHGLIIPFGLGCNKVIPIDTHDKIVDFAKSIGMPYIQPNEIKLIPDLLSTKNDYDPARKRLREITEQNLEFISKYIKDKT